MVARVGVHLERIAQASAGFTTMMILWLMRRMNFIDGYMVSPNMMAGLLMLKGSLWLGLLLESCPMLKPVTEAGRRAKSYYRRGDLWRG